MNKKMGSGFHPFHLKQFYMPMKTLRFDWLSLDKPRSLCLYVSWGHFATHALIKFVRRVRRHFHIFSALQRIFNWVIDTFFVIFFWRGMKVYDKFTTISNSVDTRGVCWLFGWVYFNDQSANKTRKKAENLKFKIWFTDDQDVHMRLQIFKVNLKMFMSYFYELRSCMWRRSWDIRFGNRR